MTTSLTVILCAYVFIVAFFLLIGGKVNSVTVGATFPWFYPPGWVFGLVWTCLFVLFFILLSRDATTSEQRYVGLVYYAMVLAWTPLFVYTKNYAIGFWYLLFVLALTIGYAIYVSTWYFAPQIVWITIATILSGSMYFLNG